LRHREWHAVVNAYWFPLYPAALALGKAFVGFRLRYELLASALVEGLMQIFFVFSSVFLASSARRLMLARGFSETELVPERTFYVWTASLACFFALRDFAGIEPDALLTTFMVLAVAFLLRGIAAERWHPFLMAGLSGGLAFWTKAFAFPFFLLCILCFGVGSLRNPRILRGLLFSLLAFAFVSGPWIWQISKAMGHFSVGESGPLNTAWYINGSDRFNPVADVSLYHSGRAVAKFKHPGELLMNDPEITFFSFHTIPGSTPQWDNPSYWSDGLKSRFVPRQYAAELLNDARTFVHMAPTRLQFIVFLAVLPLFGFALSRRSIASPPFWAICIVALGVTGSYMLVYFEPRYVVFSWIAIAAIYAAGCLKTPHAAQSRFLFAAALTVAALVVLYGFQESLQQFKVEQNNGDNPLSGIYDAPAFSAGAALASKFAPGAEVACVGDAACWSNPYWAKYGRVSITAIIETSNGWTVKDAETGCAELQSHPLSLDILRKHNVRAIIGRFVKERPCSADWKPLGESNQFYYLPL
jgi:hypothetical protein